MIDYGWFELCYTGPTATGYPDPICETMDFNLDGDVDLAGFQRF